jgi:hypothetical protein
MDRIARARAHVLSWLAAALIGAVPAPHADADSIVFIKEHDVWIVSPDGSGARAVTVDGDETRPYRSPSQADDGRIFAGHGPEIVQLGQHGNELARFQPKLGPDGSFAFKGFAPDDVAVTADGTKVAYTVYGYSCVPGVSCGTRQMTGYVSADGARFYGYELALTGPEWISGDRVLAFGGMFRQVVFDAIDTGIDDGTLWFNDPGDVGLRDGELSRQGDRLALVRGDGDATQLRIYAVRRANEPPAPACETEAVPALEDPSWSPDGTRLAVARADGIEVLSLPAVVDGDCPGAQTAGVVIPGGTEPDWGPADVQPRYEITAEVFPGAKLRKVLRKGLTLAVETNVAGTLAGTLLVDGQAVASGSASLAPGPGLIGFRFTKPARKRLARRKTVALHADLTFATESGVVIPVSGTVEVAR